MNGGWVKTAKCLNLLNTRAYGWKVWVFTVQKKKGMNFVCVRFCSSNEGARIWLPEQNSADSSWSPLQTVIRTETESEKRYDTHASHDIENTSDTQYIKLYLQYIYRWMEDLCFSTKGTGGQYTLSSPAKTSELGTIHYTQRTKLQTACSLLVQHTWTIHSELN
jgi:hypothetical protein